MSRDAKRLPAEKARRYDELRDAAGQVRAVWKPLAEAVAKMSPAEYARRHDAAQGMLSDNGVTYNVYDEKEGQARRWRLDILPFVIAADEWAVIEAGVVQRARLANALLADIYGPQRLISGGYLPPHIVLGHPQFLRPLVGFEPPGGVHVHSYSVDLARTPDGSWRVMASRADAVSGIGYALENRIVVGQVFSDLFSDMRVQRLAEFFQAHREAVQALAGPGRAVLLSPGPHNEAYFEHAFLAHYLDLTLVEGDDLAVHDDRVYLKTLRGLDQVSVIFRRVDSDFCDPLELRADSALGVPGLLQAVRAKTVVLANALGGSVVESPALDAYMHGAAKALLGEELLIPDIPTVWCGTAWGREEALSRLDQGIVRGAFDSRPLFSRRSTARLGRDLTAAERHALKADLARRGATLVTQDIVPPGGAPIFANGQFTTKPVTLRIFAAWTKQGYQIMPGGLARVADDETVKSLSQQSGALSKDVWIPSPGPVSTFSLLRQTKEDVAIQRTGNSPPSRAMDNLFWLGRYSERADNLGRILRTIVQRRGEGAAIAGDAAMQTFLCDLIQSVVPGKLPRQDEHWLVSTLRTLIYDRATQDGLPQLLSRVRQTAWSARDRLSLDTWQTIHLMTEPEVLRASGRAFDSAEALSRLDMLVRRGAAFAGHCAENMTRGPNWLFTDLGRRIERSLHLAWLVGQVTAPSALSESERLRIALEISSSVMTYRSRYLNTYHLAPLLDLLLLDDSNPRSVAFQLAAAERALEELERITPKGQGTAAVFYARAVRKATERDGILDEIARDPTALHAHLGRIETGVAGISDAITDAYFRHAVRHRTGSEKREE